VDRANLHSSIINHKINSAKGIHMDNRYVTDQQQVLAEMARSGSPHRQETSALVSPGGGAWIWPVTIHSHVGSNVYMVRAVTLGETGSIPAEFGEQMEATNLAESFLSQGTLAAGTYAIMYRLGEKNVFYATP
jgi:hypothetical protein